MENTQLLEFLVEAKKSTYAAWDSATKIKEKDKSTTLIYEKWDWKYHDNYFGGEPYWWREVVFYQWNPVYIMTYYGRVYDTAREIDQVYKILQQALSLIPTQNPYRWPQNYTNWEYEYINNFIWNIENFAGEEIITQNWIETYKAIYMWWAIDKK